MNKTKINVVIPLKNRGKHVKQLLHNIQQIVDETQENHLKVWIGDFHSTDIKLSPFIKQFTFPIQVILFEGKFRIAYALQKTAQKIKNPNDIIYFCDADSVFPTEIFERIRKLTIKGKETYMPCVAKETQDGFDYQSHGGKGNVGVYVEDFRKSGGWDTAYYAGAHGENTKRMNMLARTKYGKHDEHIFNVMRYKMKLKINRPIEKDQWVRYHTDRSGWGE